MEFNQHKRYKEITYIESHEKSHTVNALATGRTAVISNKLRDGGTAQFKPWLAALEGSKSKMLDLVQLYSVSFQRIPNLRDNSAFWQFLGALNRGGQSQRTTWRREC